MSEYVNVTHKQMLYKSEIVNKQPRKQQLNEEPSSQFPLYFHPKSRVNVPWERIDSPLHRMQINKEQTNISPPTFSKQPRWVS